MSVQICRWKHGYQFAYSITYDEAFEDLLKYALPVHQRYCVPGHLVAVAGQLGQLRDVPSSSYSGRCRHLSGPQMRELIAVGWSVGDHSMTHGDLNVNTYVEVVESKHKLEEAIGQTVNVFHLPGADFSFAPAARYLEQAGFLAVFFVDDRVNSPDPDLCGLGRALLYQIEGHPLQPLYDPFPREYDPYHRLHENLDTGGWLVDITHLISPELVAPWKDGTPEILDARFDCLRRVGAGREWAAEPEEVVDYILVRRAASLDPVDGAASPAFCVRLGSIPTPVKHRELTASIEWRGSTPPQLLVDGQPAGQVDRCEGGCVILTWPVRDGQLVELV